MSVHKIVAVYTVDDDGIHLLCSCGWARCLGHTPTVEEIAEAAEAHRREAEK